MTAKTTNGSGSKKVFSIPIGRLKSKTTAHYRSGSCSRSGSRSKYRNRLLRKNNQELACALSKQKERNKTAVDKNLELTTLLHESRLKALVLEKKCKSRQQEFSDYRKCVVGHIKDAVKYSVLMTESLKLAMMLSVEELAPLEAISASPQKTETHNGSHPLANPLKHRVNPMVSGHTIKYPTISLKRVDVEEIERVVDKNERPVMEHVADFHVSNSMDSSKQSSDMNLSTCVEEDEEDYQSRRASADGSNEVQDDSFRRRTVSFRSRAIETRSWDPEVPQPESTSKMSGESNISEWECTAVPEGLTKLTPVVALNDVSKFLKDSNSVIVLKMSLDNDKDVRVACPTRKSVDIEKENLPTDEILPEFHRQKSSIQPGQQVEELTREDDPLEGSSWMYPSLNVNERKSSAQNKRGKIGRKTQKSTTVSKRNTKRQIDMKVKKNQVDSNLTSVSCEHVVDLLSKRDSLVERDVATAVIANECTVRLQNLNSMSEPGNTSCNDSLDPTFKEMGEINDTLKMNVVVQSTPIASSSGDKLSPKNSASHLTLIDQVDSADKSTGSVSSTPSGVSPSQDQSNFDGSDISEKEPTPPLVDAKLSWKSYVTVRVRRLKYNDDIPDSTLSGNNIEEEKINEPVLTEEAVSKSSTFAGFDEQDMLSENPHALRKNLARLSAKHFASIETSRFESSNTTDYTSSSSRDENSDMSSIEIGARPRRRAAPTTLKEPSLNTKLRRETIGRKKRKKN